MRLLSDKRRPQWRVAIGLGLIAGTLFILLELLLGPVARGQSPWVMMRNMAAIALGPGALPPPETFDARIFVAAMLVHFLLSLIYAIVGAVLLFKFRALPATLLGALLGLVLYGINFYGFSLWFWWFAEARDWFAATVHAVFGATHGVGEPALRGLARHLRRR